MVGHERAAHHDVVAAGAAQPHRVPDVLDHVVARGQQEGAEIDRIALGVGHDPAEQHPARVIAARREAPPSAELVPAGHRLSPAGRRVGRGHPGARVGPPDVLLPGQREQRELPGVHADHRGHPAGRPAGAGDQPDHGVEGQRVGFEPAEPFWLEQPEEPGLLKRLDRLGRDHPGVLGLLRPVPQHRKQLPYGGKHRISGHRASLPRLPDVLDHRCSPLNPCSCGTVRG